MKGILGKLGRGFAHIYYRLVYRPIVRYESDEAKCAIREGGAIIASNHVTYNDGPLMYILFKNSGLLMAKDWAEKKYLSWLIEGSSIIPVDRYHMDLSWISAAREKIQNGNNMIIFPEGHTSEDNDIDDFKPGFAMLSVMTNARIVPVYNDGEYHRCIGKRIRLYVGNPVELTEDGKCLQADYLKQESAKVHDEIKKIKKESIAW
ncbi:MAG: lysophospholipid acyltransferase family protein [Eubacteriales bacterium]|nr:lysophospholipid acyltransferase family protein [Lachnospiraceae bacterium]MDO5127904.1 lysophospholipid acyltransferase family protein [Eubacteriales bacterium]